VPLLRALVVGTLTTGLALASARPALAASMDVYLRDHDRVIATAGTDANRDWPDICDRVADGRLMRAHWTGTLGLSGTVSPGDGKCSTRHMHFGFKFTSIKLCEIWIGGQEISCVSGRP
jgi:hypothetical protein